MIKYWKKTLFFLLLLVTITIWFINIQSPKQTIRVDYVDGNKTKIAVSKVLQRKHSLLPIVIVAKKFSGYSPNTKILFIFQNTQRVTFKYSPKHKDLVRFLNQKKYVATAFQVIDRKTVNGTQMDSFDDRLRIIYSENGKNWRRLAANYPKRSIRDPSMIRVGKWWYMIATNGNFMKTSDFSHWVKLKWNNGTTKFGAIWAPSFFVDKEGNVHIICAATYPNEGYFQLFVSDFDMGKGEMVGNWRRVTGGYLNQNNNSGVIDPHVAVVDNKYYLWCVRRDDTDLLLFKSDDGFTDFSNIDVKLTPQKKTSDDAYEAPAIILRKKKIVQLYYDQYRQEGTDFIYSGEHLRELNLENMSLSVFKRLKSDFLIRHMNPVINIKKY